MSLDIKNMPYNSTQVSKQSIADLETPSAVIVFTESLRQEVQGLGIEVTAIEPGYFRTNFLSSGHKSRAANLIDDYEVAIKNNMAGLAA